MPTSGYIYITLALFIVIASLVYVSWRFYFSLRSERQKNSALKESLKESIGTIEALEKDRLTRVLRREAWEKELEKRLEAAGQTLCIIDLDNLKVINDTRGHVYGDKAIELLAATLRFNLKETDLIGRYGGDEFVVALELGEEEQVREIFERIREQFNHDIQAYFAKEFGDSLTNVSFSFGCTFVPNNRRSLELAYREADTRLYEEKRQRKNMGLLN